MKAVLALLLFTLPGCQSAKPLAIQSPNEQIFYWDRFRDAWEQFRRNPGPETANRVSETVPDSGHARAATNDEERTTRHALYSYLDTLGQMIQEGDAAFARLGFRLFYFADGAFAETLDMTLGDLIPKRPKIFLRALRENRNLVIRLDGLVGNYGPLLLDNLKGQEDETQRRLKALASVSDEDLRSVRDECIKILKSGD